MRKYRSGASARTLLAIAMAFAIAALAACDGSDGEKGQGGDGDPSERRSGMNSAAVGDGGSGGDGAGGGSQDSGGGLGLAPPDDVNATTAQMYSEDAQRRVSEFQEAVAGLSMDDVASALELLQAFRRLAAGDASNDALFFAYEESMQSIAESMNSDLEGAGPDAAVISDALENGFLFVEEPESPHFILRADFFCDTFFEYVGPAVQNLLELRKKHYYFADGHDFIENSTLMVTLDELAEMVVDWENFVDRYGGGGEMPSAQIGDISSSLDYYFKVYIGAIQVENSGFYTYVGVDVSNETVIKLADEPRQSYMKFLENYPDSRFRQAVSDLFQIYESNDFVYTPSIETYFSEHGYEYT
jgi:hypothetical protein